MYMNGWINKNSVLSYIIQKFNKNIVISYSGFRIIKLKLKCVVCHWSTEQIQTHAIGWANVPVAKWTVLAVLKWTKQLWYLNIVYTFKEEINLQMAYCVFIRLDRRKYFNTDKINTSALRSMMVMNEEISLWEG